MKIGNYHLCPADKKAVLSPDKWLSDDVINAAQSLLAQVNPGIKGYQNTLLGQKANGFSSLEDGEKFIQILHVMSSHWLTVSNLKTGNNNEAIVYDSMYGKSLPRRVQLNVCSLMRKFSIQKIRFLISNVQQQSDGSSCGVFAIAFATELAHNLNPSICNFNDEAMRQHLCNCLESKKLTPFPKNMTNRKADVYIGNPIEERIYCKCRELNDPKKKMVQCQICLLRYHLECVGLVDEDTHEIDWKCENCGQL